MHLPMTSNKSDNINVYDVCVSLFVLPLCRQSPRHSSPRFFMFFFKRSLIFDKKVKKKNEEEKKKGICHFKTNGSQRKMNARGSSETDFVVVLVLV